MKKKICFSLLLVCLLAAALVFVSCDSNKEEEIIYEDLVSTSIYNGRYVDLRISQSSRVAVGTLSPATNHYYLISYVDNGEVLSSGRIEVNGEFITYNPNDGKPAFYGRYYGGTLITAEYPSGTGTVTIGYSGR